MSYQHTTEMVFAGERLAVDVEYDFEISDCGDRVFFVISAMGRWIETRTIFNFFVKPAESRVETRDVAPPFPITRTLLTMLRASEQLEEELAELWGAGAPDAADLVREARKEALAAR